MTVCYGPPSDRILQWSNVHQADKYVYQLVVPVRSAIRSSTSTVPNRLHKELYWVQLWFNLR